MARLNAVLGLVLLSVTCGAPARVSPTMVQGSVVDVFSRPVANAEVAVRSGAAEVASGTTDTAGRFAIPMIIRGTVTVTVSRDGATLLTRPVTAREYAHGRVLLKTVLPDLVQLAPGKYTATFAADTSCTEVPAELRTRTYDATLEVEAVTAPGYLLTFNARAATESVHGVFLTVSGHDIGFTTGHYAESLSADTFYQAGAGDDLAIASVTDAGLTITFPMSVGQIETCQLAPGETYRGSCSASATIRKAACPLASFTLTKK
jgi:hypothetical protein